MLRKLKKTAAFLVAATLLFQISIAAQAADTGFAIRDAEQEQAARGRAEEEAVRAVEEQANAVAQRNPENYEIERKFLVDIDKLPSYMAARAYRYDFVQTYISYEPEMRVRSYDNRYYFTAKMPVDEGGMIREEIQFQITKDVYEDLLTKRVGQTIYKTRYQFYEGDTYVFVDVYSGSLKGLAVVEVEFKGEQAANSYVPPKWFGRDITADKRYKNANLAKDGMPSPR